MYKEIINQWDAAAEKYAEDQECSEFVESNKRVVKARFQQLNGEKLLDLGCGYGVYTDYFRHIGAEPIGIDGSKKMIDIARKRYPECTFSMADISGTLPFKDSEFDIIFCNQVMMDVENIRTVFEECRRILKPGGIFYCSIVHPAFYDSRWIELENGYRYAKAVTAYIEPYCLMNDFWGQTMHFHRPLSDYLNAAADSGFRLTHTQEPVTYDGNTRNKDIPLFFFAEYRRE